MKSEVEISGVVNRLMETSVEENGKPKKSKSEELKIEPLRQAILHVPVVGVTPLKILRFSKKKQDQVMATQKAGDQAKSKKKREAKDFEQEYEDAKYLCSRTLDRKKCPTWLGLNASGIRNGCIETCRVAGLVMTKIKMTVFAVADGYDDLDGTPLCRIHGEPHMTVDAVRNASGVMDLRPRACWDEWRLDLKIRFDEGQLSASDVVNLLIRMGMQNGLGEGRPNSSNGNGTGNGVFEVDVDNLQLERLPSAPPVYKIKEV